MYGVRGFFCSCCLLLLALPFSPPETSAENPWGKTPGVDYTRPVEHQELEEYEEAIHLCEVSRRGRGGGSRDPRTTRGNPSGSMVGSIPNCK